MEPTTVMPTGPDGRPPGEQDRRWVPVVLAVVAALMALVVYLVVQDDDTDMATDTTTTSEATTTTGDEPTTTAGETTTTEAPATTDAIPPFGGITAEEAATVVWPDPTGDTRYETPEDAVAGAAEELLGFADPVYGSFMAGDSRSGEVEVRAKVDGPATTVGVRQLSDDTWYVLFAAASELELTLPVPGSAIDHPLEVEGWGRGFEGQVRVAVFERGSTTPLGEGFFIAGSGEDPAPFKGAVEWENPGGGWGAVVATTASGADGSTWAATVVPVGFIGGD